MATVGLVLLAAAVVGESALAFMLGLTVWHVRRPGLVPSEWPGISVLKPLCGNDDDLAANIASFADLPYGGEYEVVLGVRSPEDSGAVCAVLKPTLDAVAFSRLRRELFSWRAFGVVWVKDLLLFVTWVHGLFARTVVWRGNRLRVHSGSRLVPLAHPTRSGVADVTGFSEKLPPLHGPAAALMSDLRA